jgi:hypothetical protein
MENEEKKTYLLSVTVVGAKNLSISGKSKTVYQLFYLKKSIVLYNQNI